MTTDNPTPEFPVQRPELSVPKSWWKRRRNLVLLLGSGFLLSLGVLFGPWVWIHISTRHLIFRPDDPNLPRDGRVALVLGARVLQSGRLSGMLEDRVMTGMDLYQAGVTPKILMSGDNNRRNYDEVTAMRRYAVERGIPGRDVVRDFAGLRTYDSLIRTRDVFGQNRVIIVTQEFHLPRALYLARRLGMDAVGVVADRRTYSSKSLRRSQLREIPACLGAVIDVWGYRRGPKIPGPPEGLDGDNQSPRYPEQQT